MTIHHLTFATAGRLPPFPDEARRRAAVAHIHRIAGDVLVLYFVADDHLHVVLLCDRDRAGRLARALLLALRTVAHAALQPADIRPVRDRDHMTTLVPYLLTQLDRHGIDGNQATWAGSCFPDLVGARVVGAQRLRLHDALPRFHVRAAYAAIGLPQVPLRPWPVERVADLGPVRLARAAEAALCAPPESRGNRPRHVKVRACVSQLADAAGFRTADIARSLGVSPRGVRAARTKPVSTADLDAVRTWLALEDAARVLPERRAGPRDRRAR